MIDAEKRELDGFDDDTTIDFTIDGELVSIKPSEINQLFSDLENYNRQFSIGSMMAKALLGHRDSEEKGEEGFTLHDEESSQQITAFFIISAHKNLLNNMGLSLQAVSGRGATMYYEDASASEGEMSIDIADFHRFSGFLHALDHDKIKQADLGSMLGGLARSLTQRVLEQYTQADPATEASHLFDTLEELIGEYKRLGLSDLVAKLETYNEHKKMGDLSEYLAVERQGLLNKPGKFFGPADWQKDSTAESLENRWENAIDTLLRLKQNPNAADLYQTLKAHLKVCVTAALDDLERTSNPNEKLKTVLEAEKQKLDMLDS